MVISPQSEPDRGGLWHSPEMSEPSGSSVDLVALRPRGRSLDKRTLRPTPPPPGTRARTVRGDALLSTVKTPTGARNTQSDLASMTGTAANHRPRTTVLISAHDPTLGSVMEKVLTRNGYRVRLAASGEATMEMFTAIQPDLVVLEAKLAEGSGLDVCRAIRSRSPVPILFVSGRASELDIVVALEVGADDFLAKPQRLQELVARVRMLLRRVPTPVEEAQPALEVGPLRLDADRHEASFEGRLLVLPRKEFHLLRVLMERPGTVHSRRRLIEQVWGTDYVGDTKTLDVHIGRLRAKIGDDRGTPRRIVTVRGLGFKLEAMP